jgi:polyhydroxybutyrate depolymerase
MTLRTTFLTLALALFASRTASAHSTITVNAGRGPITVYVPDSYLPGNALPLVFLLHGYTSSGAGTEALVKFVPLVDSMEFLYAHPDGTVDLLGNRFWNATNACCNYFGSGVNDSQYLLNLIGEVEQALTVDPKRIYMTGHSNGGFMSYRMACDHSNKIAAIASLAGATWNNPNSCAPSEPVHVLQIHGTVDGTISYNGGALPGGLYPSAVGSVEQWANFDGCVISGVTTLMAKNIVVGLGLETDVTTYTQACGPGGSGELWTMNGVGHVPNINANFSPALIDWLYQHPKNAAPVAYCTAGTSASGCLATLAASGIPSLSRASGFVLTAGDVEGNKDGLFFYGTSGAQGNSWGSGTSFQCVVPPVRRAGLLAAVGSPGACDGSFSQDFAEFWWNAPPAKVPSAGSKAWIQLWYRDPMNSSNQTTSLSNALEVLVCP